MMDWISCPFALTYKASSLFLLVPPTLTEVRQVLLCF